MSFYAKNKKTILISSGVLATVLVGYGAFASYQAFNQPESKSVTNDSQGQQIETQNVSPANNNNDPAKTTYKIVGLNKKDGDTFSRPDTVSFSVAPKVESTKVLLTTADGKTVYEGGINGSVLSLVIYPEGKVPEGSVGTLRVEGVTGGKTMVFQNVRVVF